MENISYSENPIYTKPLKKGHSLAILQNEGADIVQVRNANGIALFTIEVSDQGTTLQIEAENITLKATKKLSLSGEEVYVKADLGDIVLKANDDIKLNGERVKLNCDI